MNLLKRLQELTTGTPKRALISSIIIALLLPLTLWASSQRWELRKEAAETPSLIQTVIDKIRPVDSELASTLETYLNQQPAVLNTTQQIMSANLSLLNNPNIEGACAIDPNSYLSLSPHPALRFRHI